MKKLLFFLMAMLFVGTVIAQTNAPWHSVTIVDETGAPVTSITSVEIYAPDTSSNAVIFADRGLTQTMTIPITESSTNTTLIDGVLSWYGPDGYDFSITDGTNIATNANHRTRTATEGRLVFPSYITAISSTTYADGESATWGTSGDWVQQGGNVTDQLSFTPLNDNANFIIGVSGSTKNSDFSVFVGTALGLKVDAGTPSLIWDGGVSTINHDSNFSVGLCTGTSTGAVTLGSATAGTITLDTTAGISITADDSYALSVTAGTASITTAGGDITIDASAESVVIRGTEEAADAILLDADGTAGGIELQCGTGDITLDSGDDIFLEADTGTGDVISIINTQGTAAAAIVVTATVGSVDINTGSDVTVDVTDDILLTSGDDTVIATTGKLTITNTEVATISGGVTITGVTTIASSLITPFEITTAENEIEITESGTVYVLTGGTEYLTRLPTVVSSAGVTFRFIVGAIPTGDDYTVLTDTLEDKISGSVVVDGANVEADGPDDTITFTRDAAAIGDWVELTSDGVLWYISGQGAAATAIVPSKAD